MTGRERHYCPITTFLTPSLHGSGNLATAKMDVQMTDRPVEAKFLLTEDTLRQIARHVKDYIPGSVDGDIEAQQM